jgi:hypothetical protein
MSLDCVTANARQRAASPPYTLGMSGTLEQARASVLAALEEEALRVDGLPASDRNVFTSTFVVRRGGMGESEIVLRLRLGTDAEGSGESSNVRLLLDATAREVRRMVLMSAEDARSPRNNGDAHPVQDNDRETLQRIGRLVARLEHSGWTRLPATTGGAGFARHTLAPPPPIALRWLYLSPPAE